MIDLYQYYPTPSGLSKRAWATFKNQQFSRVLEPSAGEGHLLKCRPTSRCTVKSIDCIEIDISKHQSLRDQGYQVIGMDFLQFKTGSIYSHILMNPPFAEGAQHVLKAWDILFEGEIVAIVNAETLKNPFSKQRQHLLTLIEQYGEVEYLQAMFSGTDAQRNTDVDIAVVWLKKSSRFEDDILGTILDDLRRDQKTDEPLADDFEPINPLALPYSFIENTVLMFNAAVESARQAVFSEARARRYSQMLGKTMGQMNGDYVGNEHDSSIQWVKQQLYDRYTGLKDRAWAGILRSTQVTSKLSSAAQKRLEADFENIKALEFTVLNIYGFLQGIVDKQGDIQMSMACDVFDLITRYYTDNTVYYLGWKSNDKHRTLGMRIKTTRFVIPGHATESYHNDLPWSSRPLLADIDKVFAMMAGKAKPDISLETVFSQHFQALRNGSRISASYFDVRYYPGVGTIHFFPTNKKLIERINWLVGSHRRWLPPAEQQAGSSFWKHYDQAEKFDKAFHAEVKNSSRQSAMRYRVNPFWAIQYGEETERQEASEMLSKAMATVLEKNGIDPDALLADSRENGLLLEGSDCSPVMPFVPAEI